jgi:hypothetical protein
MGGRQREALSHCPSSTTYPEACGEKGSANATLKKRVAAKSMTTMGKEVVAVGPERAAAEVGNL